MNKAEWKKLPTKHYISLYNKTIKHNAFLYNFMLFEFPTEYKLVWHSYTTNIIKNTNMNIFNVADKQILEWVEAELKFILDRV